MMEQITINTSEKKLLPKNALQSVTCGKFFEQFVDSQRVSPTKSHGLSPEAVATFRSETTDILCHCNPHNAVHAPETTHLVVDMCRVVRPCLLQALRHWRWIMDIV